MAEKQLFDSDAFEKEFHYDGPLGSFCSPEGTLFRLWAPTAQAVMLRLYHEGDGGEPIRCVPAVPGEKGTWVYEAGENLDGIYYDYAVTVAGHTYQTQDPYGKACGVNGGRSMVLDLRRTDPEGWENDKAPVHTPEQIIYEMHVKDFSWDENGGFLPQNRGRFSALTQTGTTYRSRGAHPTGLDYLKKLGVTHIQLMPIYDYGSVDERCPEDNYNWGYDPANYNVPEGSYSSDPHQGQVRIRELKEAIAALHRNGFRVIMDVVYNHTYQLDSCLFKTVPWYYYRQNRDGTSSNGSGCGNDLASERSMCSRYILDSVLYWAEEYHIDGFRFDLMGLLDAKLMNQLQDRLDRIYGKGEKLIYGEPWRAGDTTAKPGTVLADKSNLSALLPHIGTFCDDTRDAVKGSVMDSDHVGFANGGRITRELLSSCVCGWSKEGQPNCAPSQTVSYLSCHDDWTLWDKLVYTMDPKKDFTGSDQVILRANRLAAAALFGCQGRVFLHAGEEFGRTKGGIKNSYCSNPRINQLDWTRSCQLPDLVNYYRGLIALRQQLPGLQDKTEQAGNRIVWCREVADNCAAICLDNTGPDSKWQQLIMVFNCSGAPISMELPQGKWQLLADGNNSFCWQKPTFQTQSVTVAPYSAMYFGK